MFMSRGLYFDRSCAAQLRSEHWGRLASSRRSVAMSTTRGEASFKDGAATEPVREQRLRAETRSTGGFGSRVPSGPVARRSTYPFDVQSTVRVDVARPLSRS